MQGGATEWHAEINLTMHDQGDLRCNKNAIQVNGPIFSYLSTYSADISLKGGSHTFR